MSIPIANRPVVPSFMSSPKQPAQGDADSERGASESASASSVESEFLKIARMSPEERIQKAVLDKLGMSEEAFNKLDARAKADVMARVRDEMLREMETKGERRTGAFADFKV